MTSSLERTAVRLLLVEDDEVDRLACRRALSRQADFPIELLEASSGREGIELVRQRHPDLVLLDYHLPDVNGLEFLEALRHDSGEMPVPVMMLTGADSVGVAVEAMRSGARDYLVKDRQRSYLELLPAVIARVMGEQRLRGEKRAAEEKFRTLVEQIPAITYIAEPDAGGRLRYLSPQVQRLGYSVEQWLAEPQGRLAHVHPQDRADAAAAHARACDSGAPLRCEYRLLAPDG
ncbi:MAG: response regulator, partial [Burkholderiaceae bacterium]|nr:response regulator [Burkholderiaceae bacterium]